jgi:hypothetical protein
MPRVARLDVPGLLQDVDVIVRGVESLENRSPLGKIGIKESVALLKRTGSYSSVLSPCLSFHLKNRNRNPY